MFTWCSLDGSNVRMYGWGWEVRYRPEEKASSIPHSHIFKGFLFLIFFSKLAPLAVLDHPALKGSDKGTSVTQSSSPNRIHTEEFKEIIGYPIL